MDNHSQGHGRVLVLAERGDLEIASLTFELLGMGRRIADEIKGKLCAVVLGQEITEVTKELAHFVDEVYSLDHLLLGTFNPELYTKALEQLCQKVNPIAVLMGGTVDNLTLAPKLAYKLGVDVITDCVQLVIQQETGDLLCTKPVYGAKILSTFKLEKKPYIVTIRPKSREHIKTNAVQGRVILFNPVIEASMVKVELIEKVREENIDLSKAEAIVAGGRGIKDDKGLEELKELVEVLKKYFSRVELGASRPLVDARLVSPSRQIGLTGEKVAPELYIAVGISGAMQHLTGISGAKKIVAINNSSKAYIFEFADYGVIGNFEDVVPAFRRKLKEFQ